MDKIMTDVNEEFKAELRVLLKKYDASIGLEANQSYHPYRDAEYHVNVDGPELDIDLGAYFDGDE